MTYNFSDKKQNRMQENKISTFSSQANLLDTRFAFLLQRWIFTSWIIERKLPVCSFIGSSREKVACSSMAWITCIDSVLIILFDHPMLMNIFKPSLTSNNVAVVTHKLLENSIIQQRFDAIQQRFDNHWYHVQQCHSNMVRWLCNCDINIYFINFNGWWFPIG